MLSVFAAPTRADILLLPLRLLHTDELGSQGLARLHCGQGQAPWLASACLAVWTWPTDALLVLRIRRNGRRISVDIESWPPLVHCMVACVQFALRVHGRRACKGQSPQKNMWKAIHPTCWKARRSSGWARGSSSGSGPPFGATGREALIPWTINGLEKGAEAGSGAWGAPCRRPRRRSPDRRSRRGPCLRAPSRPR